jgi:hypothetical protein
MRAPVSWGRGGFGVALLATALLAACGDGKPTAAAAEAAVKTVSDFFPIKVGEKTVRMQLVVLAPEMEHGLMDRRDLGRDDGMIFVYAKPQQMSFWMHNTPTPLDIGFFDSGGVLREFYPMQPFDETTVTSRSDELHYALEMNQGWYRGNGIKPGAQLDLKALAAALKARGFEPRKFGLAE